MPRSVKMAEEGFYNISIHLIIQSEMFLEEKTGGDYRSEICNTHSWALHANVRCDIL